MAYENLQNARMRVLASAAERPRSFLLPLRREPPRLRAQLSSRKLSQFSSATCRGASSGYSAAQALWAPCCSDEGRECGSTPKSEAGNVSATRSRAASNSGQYLNSGHIRGRRIPSRSIVAPRDEQRRCCGTPKLERRNDGTMERAQARPRTRKFRHTSVPRARSDIDVKRLLRGIAGTLRCDNGANMHVSERA